MTFKIWIALLVALQNVQADEAPSYVREGDRVEQVFRDYRENLTSFYNTLRSAAERDDSRPIAPLPPPLMNELREAPPRPVTYGYQLLPALVDEVSDRVAPEVDQRNYSWPITESYIEGEKVKLEWAITDFRKAGSMEAVMMASEQFRPSPLPFQDSDLSHNSIALVGRTPCLVREVSVQQQKSVGHR